MRQIIFEEDYLLVKRNKNIIIRFYFYSRSCNFMTRHCATYTDDLLVMARLIDLPMTRLIASDQFYMTLL